MQVSVKKKSNPEVASFVDVKAELAPLVKRELPAEPAATPIAAPKVERLREERREEVKVEVKAEVIKKVSPKRPSILNLGELLSSGERAVEATSEGEEASELSNIDPKSGDKLNSARGAIVEFLGGWRPRFVAAFESMTISGNTISIAVSTSELKEEILRSKTEFLTKVVSIAQIDGVVELHIEVNESIKSFKPIKLEDRIAHIMELNPLIVELKEALDLDVEG